MTDIGNQEESQDSTRAMDSIRGLSDWMAIYTVIGFSIAVVVVFIDKALGERLFIIGLICSLIAMAATLLPEERVRNLLPVPRLRRKRR